MKIKTKRTVMIVFLLAGVIWNCLCILNVIPLSYFSVSAIIIGGYSFIIALMPLLFPPFIKIDEKSNHYSELTIKEKYLSVITIVLVVVWIITLITCIIM